MAAQKHTDKIDLNDLLPCVDWVHPCFVVWPGDSGVGDKDVDSPELLDSRVRSAKYTGGVGHIDSGEGCLMSAPESGLGRCELLLVAIPN